MRPDRTQPGLYEGFFSPPATGRYRLEANENDQAVSNTTEFQVVDVKTELLDTAMRRAHLEHIAERTGGPEGSGTRAIAEMRAAAGFSDWNPSHFLDTAEMYPTRIRGVGNGFSWAVAFMIGYVLWPFVSVWLRESSGSFHTAFLMIPVFMLGQAAVVWFFSPEHVGKDLDAIHV